MSRRGRRLAAAGEKAVFADEYQILVVDLRTGRSEPIPGADRPWSPRPSSDAGRVAFSRHDSEAEGAVAYVAFLEPR